MKRQLRVNLDNLLLSLSEVTDLANPLIAQHQHRVAFIALELARYANLESEITENIFTAALLHDIGGLERIAEWAAYHHEKLDGSGYPFHLASEEIGTGSRIMAVADIFTAISEDRPYRRGMDKDQIYKVIKMQTDKKLIDKRIVELLFDNYETINISVKEKQSKALDFYEKRFLSIAYEDKHNVILM